MGLSIESKCIHLEDDNRDKRFGAISVPIYQTATYAHPGLGESTGYDYSRVQNPTREYLEKTIAALENGTDALAFSSGMAALATLLNIFKPGDHLIVDSDLYGGSTRLFHTISEKNGLEFDFIDFSKEDAGKFVKKNTVAFFIETPTNPLMNVVDIKKVADIAHSNGALLIVDNTFMSPYLQNPLDLGADVVAHSGTKYISGHNDALSGFLVVKDNELSEKLRFIYKTIGPNLAPFDSYLVIRGIKTLAVRMDRACENAQRLAEFLQNHKMVKRVIYPGLKEHPGHELMKKQTRGFGAMITFDVLEPEKVGEVLKNIELIQYAESLGGTESLLTYPITQTHADVPKEILNANGLYDTTLRFSVGIEKVDDLIEDLDRALSI